jgi:hypothetical protein
MIAYICSPYQSETKEGIKKNIETAERISLEAYKNELIPLCVHTFLERTTGLAEETGDRKELLRIGREFVKTCDAIIINEDSPISPGMKEEIKTANEHGILQIYYREGKIRFYTEGGDIET